jgi:Glycosyl hydrolase family 63 C-terminal domain
MSVTSESAESQRLNQANKGTAPWRFWGPYLSERQWGTVREDYSSNGDAWSYFSHDNARSRVYLWGEDGLAGICDEKQRLCFSVALWNGRDSILKERLFGLTNTEGNHGEDVKEYYFYLDSTPTHSYMKYLYKYPQAAYPYDDIVKTNHERTRFEPEYELLDTGVFNDDRYFDVFVEYAKSGTEDMLVRITAKNRGDQAAELYLLPQLWFRNTWRHFGGKLVGTKPMLRAGLPSENAAIVAEHETLGSYTLSVDQPCEMLFTENETNNELLWKKPNDADFVNDAFHRYLIVGEKAAVNPARTGTKAMLSWKTQVPAHGEAVLELRLCRQDNKGRSESFGAAFDAAFRSRAQESEDFYAKVIPSQVTEDERNVMRQALAGMLWTKQYYFFDLDRWLEEHGVDPAISVQRMRNSQWSHMVNDDVISMPDKWEYPWYAAWDLAFHCVALSLVDMEFAKSQMLLMLHEMYIHPNGQVPAYEWNFGDVNPPVHAWATLFLYHMEKEQTGKGDLRFIKLAYHKLLMNFTWWVNRKDRDGRNVFEGGFLGLDNIGIFDRSAPLPTGGYLEQADGTAWMVFYSQCMLQMSLELAPHDPIYEDFTQKFVEHFFRIAGAMDRIGINQDELWDEEDGFFYDLLRTPDGGANRLKVRSVVGLLPLCAVVVIEPGVLERLPHLLDKVQRFCDRQPELLANLAPPFKEGHGRRHLLAVLSEDKLRRVLNRMLDPERFLGPHGIRSLSRWHLDHPFTLSVHGQEYSVQYMAGESNNGMFGGNSNWRGPVWMPINVLIVRSLLMYYQYYGDDFQVECPTGSGKMMNLYEIAQELSHRLVGTFLQDNEGHRPVYGKTDKFQNDPHWRDLILFYEYFHGDTGEGVGASHQTGWTGTVAKLIQTFGVLTPEVLLGSQASKQAAVPE